MGPSAFPAGCRGGGASKAQRVGHLEPHSSLSQSEQGGEEHLAGEYMNDEWTGGWQGLGCSCAQWAWDAAAQVAWVKVPGPPERLLT